MATQQREGAIIRALLELAALGDDAWPRSLQRILCLDSEVLDVERVSYWSLRQDPPGLFCEQTWVRAAQRWERGMFLAEQSHARYFAEVRTATLIVVEDALDDPRTSELRDYFTQHRISALVDGPVWVAGHLAGVVCHEHVGPPRRWAASEQAFALSAAQGITTALQARARTRAEQAEQRAIFLEAAASSMFEARDPREVARRIVRAAVGRLAEGASLYLVDADRIVATAHRDPDRQQRIEARLAAGGFGNNAMLGVVARTNKTVLVPDVAVACVRDDRANTALVEFLQSIGARTAMMVPLRAGGVGLGALLLLGPGGAYDHDDVQLAEDFARRAAGALENARSHAEAQRAIAARDEFLDLAAHELKTPLTSLTLAVAALGRAAATPAKHAHFAQAIGRQSKRLTHLVDTMLVASRLRTDELDVHREPIDLAALVRAVAADASSAATGAPCRVTVRAETPVRGDWDPARMEQMLTLVLDNAVKFGGHWPIDVGLEEIGGAAVLTIRDRGVGIESARAAEVFDPFQRGVPSSSYGGLGLGLFVARRIIEAHGGSIGIESQPGQGTVVTVVLPGATSARERASG